MAQLAVAGVGALVGAAFEIGTATEVTLAGVLSAASLGFSIGSVAGGLLFPAQSHTQGARLNDLSVTGSGYGGNIPFGTGRIRLSGNIIWSLPLQETTKNSGGKKGGKGGKSGASSTTFSYAATFAVAICEGPVSHITRIWADSNLIYDATGTTDNIQKPGLSYRFYPGNETQLPDSLIEADKGVGNVPGHRGICYIVFDSLPLADYGNRIPNINVEVAFVDSPAFVYTPLVRASSGGIFGGVANSVVAINPFTLTGYVAGTSPNGIIEFDLTTMQTTRETADADILTDGSDGGVVVPGVLSTNLLVTATGALVWSIGSSGIEGPRLLRVNQHTMKQTAEFDAPAAAGNTTTAFGTPWYLTNLAYADPAAGVIDYIVVGGLFGDIGVLNEADLSYFWGDGQKTTGSRTFAVTTGKVAPNLGEAWVLSGAGLTADHIYIDRLRVENGVLDYATMLDLVPTDIDPAGIAFLFSGDPSAFIYDQSDNSLLLKVTTLSAPLTISQTLLVKWTEDGGILFATPDTGSAAGGRIQSNSFIAAGNYAIMSEAYVLQINAQSGEVTTSNTWPISNALHFCQAYDSLHQLLIAYVTPTSVSDPRYGTSFWAKLLINRVDATSATLQQCYDLVLDRAGYEPADYDTDDLAAVTVPGFVVSQMQSGANILMQLASVFLLDAVESDYAMVFRRRGGAIAATITEDELIRLTGDNQPEPYKETRLQEQDLPLRMTLTYYDLDRNYQTNTVQDGRVREPYPTMFSDQKVGIQLGLVLTATTAQQAVETMLYSAWLARHSFQVRLPQKYLWLDSADPIQLQLNSGYTMRARMGKTDFGVDYAVDSALVAESDGQYVSLATAEAPPILPNVVPAVLPVELLLLDTPLLLDTDEAGSGTMIGFWAASSYVDHSFAGALLDQSMDLSAFVRIDATATAATWGHVTVPPADPGSMFHTQMDGTLTVYLQQGGAGLGSITELQLANGGNPAALIKSNGEVEIIQYRDVVALGGSLYQLSVLNRGRRGTDTMGFGHAAGETLVMLDTPAIRKLNLPATLIGMLTWWRAVAANMFPEMALVEGFTFHGRDKMPYAPVSVAGALSGSPPDILLTWVRRTRLAGQMVDGTGTVPLEEASELYSVDILDAPGGTVLRTLSGITSPTVTYTAAQITADFGSTPAELSVVVYQISAIVGRGFGREDLLEIA